ncbi:EF-hand domain-containing protein [Streptomyces sp. NBC_00876]|uniref:EF-hand domain-containing protein n=1 Tax=Streptomyces sp. NBC_00876 TaxID=2975853 RepID=UPI0038644089|nr:EF-hand domain-containing protein [Streptomyces sp. NBC_00876]
MSRYEDIWNYLTAKAGGVHVVTREQFEVIGAAHANGEGAPWFSMLRRYMTAMVQLCDTDGDGKVQPPEFSKWVEAVNFGFGARIDTSVAFKSVDTNGDGSVSVDELCAAQKAYDEGTLDVSLLG